jgi:hypothetical protein
VEGLAGAVAQLRQPNNGVADVIDRRNIELEIRLARKPVDQAEMNATQNLINAVEPVGVPGARIADDNSGAVDGDRKFQARRAHYALRFELGPLVVIEKFLAEVEFILSEVTGTGSRNVGRGNVMQADRIARVPDRSREIDDVSGPCQVGLAGLLHGLAKTGGGGDVIDLSDPAGDIPVSRAEAEIAVHDVARHWQDPMRLFVGDMREDREHAGSDLLVGFSAQQHVYM